jgi:hypothetical protein
VLEPPLPSGTRAASVKPRLTRPAPPRSASCR